STEPSVRHRLIDSWRALVTLTSAWAICMGAVGIGASDVGRNAGGPGDGDGDGDGMGAGVTRGDAEATVGRSEGGSNRPALVQADASSDATTKPTRAARRAGAMTALILRARSGYGTL